MGRKITKLAVSEPIPTRKKVAAYARVSCGKDEMLHSLAAQVSYYREYIQSQSGWAFAGVYADESAAYPEQAICGHAMNFLKPIMWRSLFRVYISL